MVLVKFAAAMLLCYYGGVGMGQRVRELIDARGWTGWRKMAALAVSLVMVVFACVFHDWKVAP